MKFEKELHEFTLGKPRWPMIRYGYFKTKLKLDWPEASFSSDFADNIAEVEEFIRHQLSVLKSNIPENLPYGSSELSEEAFVGVDVRELQGYCREIEHLIEEFKHLMSYIHFNRDGFDRIVEKSQRKERLEIYSIEAPSFPELLPIALHLERLPKFLDVLKLNCGSQSPFAANQEPGFTTRFLVNTEECPVSTEFEQAVKTIWSDDYHEHHRTFLVEASVSCRETAALLRIACIAEIDGFVESLLAVPAARLFHLEAPFVFHSIVRQYSYHYHQASDNSKASAIRLINTLMERFLIYYPSVFLTSDPSGRLLLHYILEMRDEELVERFIEYMRIADNSGSGLAQFISKPDFQNKSPLWICVATDFYTVMDVLLRQYDYEDLASDTAVFQGFVDAQLRACDKGQIYMVSFFSELGVIQNAGRIKGESLVHTAARNGVMDTMEAILEGSSRRVINSRDAIRSWTPIFFACDQGHLGTVSALVTANADLTLRDALGWTAIERAEYRGHRRVVEWLDPGRFSLDSQRLEALSF